MAKLFALNLLPSLLFCLVELGTPAQATAAVSPLPDAVRYVDLNPVGAATHAPSGYDQLLKKRGYSSWEGQGSRIGGYALLWLNRVYYAPSNSKGRIYVKGGLTITGPAKPGQVYYLATSKYVAHFPGDRGQSTLVYFDGMSEQAAQNLARDLGSARQLKAVSEKHLPAWALTFTPSGASAAEPTNYFCENGLVSDEYIPQSFSKLTATLACAGGALKGTWDGTIGMWGSLADSVMHPVDTVKRIGQEIAAMNKFFLNFSSSMAEAKQLFDSLPQEVKIEITCETVGTMAGPAAATLLTAGGASASLGLSFAKALEKVAVNLRKIGKIKDLEIAKKLETLAHDKRAAAEATLEGRKAIRDVKKGEMESAAGFEAQKARADLESTRAEIARADKWGYVGELEARNHFREMGTGWIKKVPTVTGEASAREAEVVLQKAYDDISRFGSASHSPIGAFGEAEAKKIDSLLAEQKALTELAKDVKTPEQAKIFNDDVMALGRKTQDTFDILRDPSYLGPAWVAPSGQKPTIEETNKLLGLLKKESEQNQTLAAAERKFKGEIEREQAAIQGKARKNAALGTGVAACKEASNVLKASDTQRVRNEKTTPPPTAPAATAQ